MRFAVDTGGTFTDLVIEDEAGNLEVHKAPTVPSDPVQGVLDVFELASTARGLARAELLAGGDTLLHGTTHAINAVLTGRTARTGFVTTAGHPDVLLLREGGRSDVFNHSRPYPEPYVPRSLTFELSERIDAAGGIVTALDEGSLDAVLEQLAAAKIEAVGVCLLWSIVNPAHELRVGERIESELPGVAVTLSHQLNPTMREYRRASAACIDASLKPLMRPYLAELESRLLAAGFGGRLLVFVSSGGVLDAAAVAAAPIHSLGSGPAMAPVAGAHFAGADASSNVAIVADAGGTSYDVSLVRRGRIPWTRETWVGDRFFGHMTGFPSVDVRSVGAGGGSIASIDGGGLLHVGPESAGAVPGPVAYARGGTRPTVTDACVVLGYLDPEHFLGGRMSLDKSAATAAIDEQIARPLELDVHDAALAILDVATERMIAAIEAITIHQGIDPARAVLIGGGGAAGLNSVAIARRLGCRALIMPRVGSALSAAGGLLSDLTRDYAVTFRTTDRDFDYAGVNRNLAALIAKCDEFIAAAAHVVESRIEISLEARYPHQAWELDVPVPVTRFTQANEVEALQEGFHRVHREIFAIADEESPIEIQSWRARAICRLREPGAGRVPAVEPPSGRSRRAYFRDEGEVQAAVLWFDELSPGRGIRGPAIVESDFTTVVVDSAAEVMRAASGSLSVSLRAAKAPRPAQLQGTAA
jgi:N-methylhydantoinase A